MQAPNLSTQDTRRQLLPKAIINVFTNDTVILQIFTNAIAVQRSTAVRDANNYFDFLQRTFFLRYERDELTQNQIVLKLMVTQRYIVILTR